MAEYKLPEVRLHFKGELADGHVHMTAAEFHMRKIDATHYAHQRILKKMANNPILSDDARIVLDHAVFYIDMLDWWRKRGIENMKNTPQTGLIRVDGMNVCRTCGTPVEEWYDFCPVCGKEIRHYEK